jgi:hypothetical protein
MAFRLAESREGVDIGGDRGDLRYHHPFWKVFSVDFVSRVVVGSSRCDGYEIPSFATFYFSQRLRKVARRSVGSATERLHQEVWMQREVHEPQPGLTTGGSQQGLGQDR